MAAIVNTGGAAAGSTSPISVSGTGAPSATGSADPTATTPDLFDQLIAEMLSANASQTGAPASQDLASVDLTGDSLEVPTDDRDSDSDDSDDEEASALAALFSGLAGLAPLLGAGKAPLSAPSGTAAGGAALTATSIENALVAKSADIEATEAAIAELIPDSADARADQDADPSSSSSATMSTNGTSATNPSNQIHAMLAAHGASDVDMTPDATLSAPVGTQRWKDELGTQLTWMALNNRDAASLRLSPEHLGPLEVRISMREGEASVYFGASNADTRTALEQSLPRLRELFASQGLVLVDAGVSRDAPRHSFKPSTQPGTPRSVSDASLDSSVKSVTLSRAGLIDTYV